MARQDRVDAVMRASENGGSDNATTYRQPSYLDYLHTLGLVC